MVNKNKISTKLTAQNLNFLKRIAVNRIKSDMEIEMITPSNALVLIENYFKLNNDEYIDMINMENDNNGH